jgi:hypothetical protein
VDRIAFGSGDLLDLVRRVKSQRARSWNIGGLAVARNFGGPMDDSGRIRVLLVGDSSQLFFYKKHFMRISCECEFAECEREVWEMLAQRQFDLVLSLRTTDGTRSPSLVELLRGSPTTLFYALRVEVGYWWVPILRLGKECFGAPALRPSEFSTALGDVLKEIKAEATWSAKPLRTI